MAKGLNALNPFTTPVRNFFQRPAKRRHHSEDSDSADAEGLASSFARSSGRLALQTNDTDVNAVIVTALDTPPFCCHEDLLTMPPAQLGRVAASLNARLPMALRIDTNADSPAIRAAIEVLVGIRADNAPPTPARPSTHHSHRTSTNINGPDNRSADSVHHAPRRIRRLPASALVLALRDEDEDGGGSHALLRMDRDPPSSPLARRTGPPTPPPRAFPRTPTLARIEEEAASVPGDGGRPVKRRRVFQARETDSEDAEIDTPTWRASARHRSSHDSRARVHISSARDRRSLPSASHSSYASTLRNARTSATQAMHLPFQPAHPGPPPAIPLPPCPSTDAMSGSTHARSTSIYTTSTSMTVFRERTSTASSSAESICRERTESTSSVGSVLSVGSAMITSSMYSTASAERDATAMVQHDNPAMVQDDPHTMAQDEAEYDVVTPVVQQGLWGAHASSTPLAGKGWRAEDGEEECEKEGLEAEAWVQVDEVKDGGSPDEADEDESPSVIDGWTEGRARPRAAARPSINRSWTGNMEEMRVAGDVLMAYEEMARNRFTMVGDRFTMVGDQDTKTGRDTMMGQDAEAGQQTRADDAEDDCPTSASTSRRRLDKRWAMHLADSP